MKIRNCFMSLLTLPICLFASFGEPHNIVQEPSHAVNLGELQIAGLVVSNIETSVAQWSAGTGSQFSPITTNQCVVFLDEGGPTNVTLKSAYSIYSNPFLELVEANPRVGPWAPQTGPGGSVGYQVYAVHNIHQVDSTMRDAGLTRVAFCGNEFAFYKAANGLLVKVINQNLLPPTGGINIPQAAIDIGPIKHVDMAIRERDILKEQFGTLLSIDWEDVFFESTPLTFPEGTQLVEVNVAVSDRTPQIQLEKITPPLGVFASSPTSYSFHPAYVVPAGTVDAVRIQMEAAGYVLNTSATIPGLGLVLAYFFSPDGQRVEVVDERVDF